MVNNLYRLYAYLFAKPVFRKVNTFLYHLGLRGLGVLNYQDEYLQGESYWLKKYLKSKKKPIVFDVGANVGNYSKSVFEANPEAIVYGFEPHPKTYLKLISNIHNKNFYPTNSGVGSESGILELFDYADNDGSSHASLYKDVISDLHKGNPISHQINILRLDDFIERNEINSIDLLKIDTEGHEFSVLQGAKKALESKKIIAIHFEFNEMNIVSKVSFKDFWDLLNGYRFYRILPRGGMLEIRKYSPINCEVFAFQNIVAIADW